MVVAGYLRGGCLEATEEQAPGCAVRFTGCAATRAGRVGCGSEPGLLILRPALSRFGTGNTTHTTRGDGWLGQILDFGRLPLGPLPAACITAVQLEAALAAHMQNSLDFTAADTKSDIY